MKKYLEITVNYGWIRPGKYPVSAQCIKIDESVTFADCIEVQQQATTEYKIDPNAMEMGIVYK